MNNSSSIHATCDFWTNLFLDKQICCWPAGNGAVLQDNVVRMQSQAVTCMELTQGTRIGENLPPKDDGGLELRPSARSLILFPLFWKIALVEILLLRPLSPCGPGLPAGVRSAGEKAGAIRDLGKGPKAAHFGSGLRVLRVEGEVHGGTAPVYFFFRLRHRPIPLMRPDIAWSPPSREAGQLQSLGFQAQSPDFMGMS